MSELFAFLVGRWAGRRSRCQGPAPDLTVDGVLRMRMVAAIVAICMVVVVVISFLVS